MEDIEEEKSLKSNDCGETRIGLSYLNTLDPTDCYPVCGIPHDFPTFPQNFVKIWRMCPNSNAYLDILIYEN